MVSTVTTGDDATENYHTNLQLYSSLQRFRSLFRCSARSLLLWLSVILSQQVNINTLCFRSGQSAQEEAERGERYWNESSLFSPCLPRTSRRRTLGDTLR